MKKIIKKRLIKLSKTNRVKKQRQIAFISANLLELCFYYYSRQSYIIEPVAQWYKPIFILLLNRCNKPWVVGSTPFLVACFFTYLYIYLFSIFKHFIFSFRQIPFKSQLILQLTNVDYRLKNLGSIFRCVLKYNSFYY